MSSGGTKISKPARFCYRRCYLPRLPRLQGSSFVMFFKQFFAEVVNNEVAPELSTTFNGKTL